MTCLTNMVRVADKVARSAVPQIPIKMPTSRFKRSPGPCIQSDSTPQVFRISVFLLVCSDCSSHPVSEMGNLLVSRTLVSECVFPTCPPHTGLQATKTPKTPRTRPPKETTSPHNSARILLIMHSTLRATAVLAYPVHTAYVLYSATKDVLKWVHNPVLRPGPQFLL